MKQQPHQPDSTAPQRAGDAHEKRSGEGAASALARLRMQERAKAAQRPAKQPPGIWF
jgi:hypothetical protein